MIKMDTGSYFRAKREITNYCEKGNCHGQRSTDCPLHIMNNGMYVRCSVLEQDYPEVAEKLLYEAIREKFPNGYIICVKDRKYEDIEKCNKFKNCKECKGE